MGAIEEGAGSAAGAIGDAHDRRGEPARHAPAPRSTGLRRLLAPGWLRAAWMTPLFFGIGFGIVACALAGQLSTALVWEIIVTVGALTVAPIGFLAGIGAFDYWTRYAIGKPTEPGGPLGARRLQLARLLRSTPTTR